MAAFKFLIGPFQVERYIHPGPIKLLSDSLSKLLASPFEEAATRVVKFPEAEPETFDHFTSWAYFGNYILNNLQRPETSNKTLFDEPLNGLTYFFCRWCCDHYHNTEVARGMYPFCSTRCKNMGSNTQRTNMRHYCAKCCTQITTTNTAFREGAGALCSDCTQQQKARKGVARLWPESRYVAPLHGLVPDSFHGYGVLPEHNQIIHEEDAKLP